MIKSAAKSFLLALCAAPAAAQQSVVEHCRDTSSDADQIACLEAALLGRDYAVAAPTPAARIDSPSMEIDAGVADDAIQAAPVEAAELILAADRTPVGIGAEQVILQNQTREDRDEHLESALGEAVAGYQHVPYERLVVTLENGQVWRQIKGDTARIRVSLDRNQTVDISESGLGGYKLRLNEMRRTIRVERIK